MKRVTFAATIAVLVAIPSLGQTRIRAVRYWSLGEVTRVAIETNRETTYTTDRVDNPDRVFFDLPDTTPQGRGIETIPVGDRLLKQIRIARTQPTVTRVVLDLAVPADFVVSQLSNPDRIMVELRLPGKATATPPERSMTGNHPIPKDEPEEAEGEAEEEAAAPVLEKPRPPARPFTMPPVRAARRGPMPEPPMVMYWRHSAPRSMPDPMSRMRDRQLLLAAVPANPTVELRTQPRAEPPPAVLTKPESRPAAESAQAAKLDSHGERSLTRVLGLKLARVVIDPGHGGHDTGTTGPGGLEEKDLVLDIAQRLGALITQRLGSEVVYTRTDDTFVPLETRTELANEKRADLFLSLHANSSRLRGISGSEVFYLNFTTLQSSLEVAARENATSEKSIHELQNLVQKIALKEKIQESREFAGTVQSALYTGLWRARQVKNRGVKQAPFVVLIGAQMPSVLAEIAFLSNPRDEIQLKRPEYRQKVAEALYKGVSQYANTLSHFEVARSKDTGTQTRSQ